MAHKVNFFDLDQDFDWDDVMRPVQVIETDDWAEAQRLAFDRIRALGSISVARLAPDHTIFETLEGYITALNAEADYLEAHPQKGCWMSQFTTDPAHWAEIGVITPADMAAYLDGCFEREMEKAAYA